MYINDKKQVTILCPKNYFTWKGMLVSWSGVDLFKVKFVYIAWSIWLFYNMIIRCWGAPKLEKLADMYQWQFLC